MISSYAKRLFGIVSVEQKGRTVYVDGVSTWDLIRDLQSTWSGKLANNLLTVTSNSKFKISAFFVPELVYIFEQLLERGIARTSRRTLLNVLAGIRANTWYAEIYEAEKLGRTRLDRSKLSAFTLTPLPNQDKFFEEYDFSTAIMGKRGHICAAPPGSGKTYMTLAAMEMVGVDYVIITAPSNTIEDPWRLALSGQELYKRPQNYWIISDGKPYAGQKFIVGHHDALGKLLEVAQQLPKGATKGFIADEGHALNELNRQRTQHYLSMAALPGMTDIINSTGTPIKAMGAEVIPFLIATDDYFGPYEQARFIKAFGRNGQGGADIIQNRMSMVMTTFDKSEIRPEKPEIMDVLVRIPNRKEFTLDVIREKLREFILDRVKYYKSIEDITEKNFLDGIALYKASLPADGKGVQWKAFNQYIEDIKLLRSVKSYFTISDKVAGCNAFERDVLIPYLTKFYPKEATEFKNSVVAYKYVVLKIQGEALGNVVGKARKNCAVAIAQHIDYRELMAESDSKTLIFSNYIDPILAAKAKIDEIGEPYEPMVFYGANKKELPAILRAFQANPKADPLITTYKSLSTGTPLVSASMVITIDFPFRDYTFNQTISRVDRLGQTKTVRVRNCKLDTGTEPNISTRGEEILKWAQLQVEELTGVKAPYAVEAKDTGLESWTEYEQASLESAAEAALPVDRTFW